jgi:hypothetical protein
MNVGMCSSLAQIRKLDEAADEQRAGLQDVVPPCVMDARSADSLKFKTK